MLNRKITVVKTTISTIEKSKLISYQLVEDVSLVNVDGDQSFKLHSLHFGQIPSGDVNQLVQNVQEELVCLTHDLEESGKVI